MRRFVGQFTLWQIMAVIAAVGVLLAVGRVVPVVVVQFVVMGCWFLASWEAKRGRPGVDRESGHLTFQHGVGARLFAILLVVTVAAASLLAASKLRMKSPFAVRELSVEAILFFIALLYLWRVTRFSIVVSPEGLDFRSPWRRGFFVAWQDIEEVHWSWSELGLVIRSCHGRKINVPHGIAGFRCFLGEVEGHLGASGLDKPYGGYINFKRRSAGTHGAA